MLIVSASNEPMQEPTNLLHFNEREFILFDFWKVGTAFGMFGSMMIVFLIAILHEAVIGTRVFVLRENIPLSTYSTEQLYENTINQRVEENAPRGIRGVFRRISSAFTWFRIGNSVLYGVQWMLMALLILFITTFNIWIIIAVLLGKIVGHFIFLGSARVSEQSLILEGGVVRESPIPERRICA
ncbi:unnamed protein product [Bursaphelenchus xylophilus]|uniref:Copper transport protein n=1 Tax=Bursaphelenchus xylophilus TaxID=6326 RepID=A0A1I7RQ71_BURXY|nr:unnamed protein product [Bursaphelenchus xylophilus]CAG9097256.1 unnamed protein product [Bursaphelenchus xylophilus]